MINQWQEKLDRYKEEIDKLRHKYNITSVSIRDTFSDKFYVVVWFYTLERGFSVPVEYMNSPFFLEVLEDGIKELLNENTHQKR